MEKRLEAIERRVQRLENRKHVTGEAGDDLLSTRDVGVMLGKSRSAVRLLVDQGKLEAEPSEPGSPIRIRRNVVTAYIERLRARVRRRVRVGGGA